MLALESGSHNPQIELCSCRKISSGLPLILCYGELYNHFIFHYISRCNSKRSQVHNKCNALESSPNHSPYPLPWKIVFHEAGPWCQRVWGPLLQSTGLPVWRPLAFVRELQWGVLSMSPGLRSPTPEGKVEQEPPDLLLQGWLSTLSPDVLGWVLGGLQEPCN